MPSLVRFTKETHITITRSLILASALLALFVSACSQPKGLTAPTLEPQFGTADDNIGFSVSVTSDGRIAVLSENEGYETFYDANNQPYYLENEALNLLVYDRDGAFVSSTHIADNYCDLASSDCSVNRVKPRSLSTDDAEGHLYALFSYGSDEEPYVEYRISDINYGVSSDGSLGLGGTDLEHNVIAAAVDPSGNIYVAKVDYPFYGLENGTYTNIVAKYTLQNWGYTAKWQRTSTVGIPYGIAVSKSGSVFVAGTKGVARYTNSGDLTWSKAADNSKGYLPSAGEVVVSGSNVYTRSVKTIRKYDSSGRQLWSKTQGGLNTIVVQDMTGDANGNLYLSGKYQASTGNFNAFARKLNSSGSALWTKTYGTPYYDDARGITTLSGSEIYVTGETQGSLAHPNLGGPQNRDGYLRKLNSSGSPIWTR